MLDVKLGVARIDYEQSIENLAGRLIGKLGGSPHENMVFRLIQELGEDAPTVIKHLLCFMSNEDKTLLICELVNSFRNKITGTINQSLAAHSFGKYVRLGEIDFRARGEGIIIHAKKISVDCKGLLMGNSPVISEKFGFLIKFAGLLPGSELEKRGLAILNTPENQKKASAFLEKFLNNQGLIVKIGQVRIEQSLEGGTTVPSEDGLKLSPEMKESLMKALASYLKESAKRI